jgi:hypothetical protein
VKKRPTSRARKVLAYQRTFNGDGKTPHLDGQIILEDLRKFAHIDGGGIVVSPTQQMTDPFATCYRAGLRDMYLRVARMLGLDEADVFDTTEETNNESAPT